MSHGVPLPPPGWQVESRASVSSTQAVLVELLEGRPRDRLAVVAAVQSEGRGRSGNRWESPPGGLWCSLSLLLPGDPDPFVGLIVARAALRAVRGLLPSSDTTRLGLKWPNDLMAGGSKWGGVLTEAESLPQGSLCRVGVGLNLDIPRSRLPEVTIPITSVRSEFGHSPAPEVALSAMLAEIDLLLIRDRDEGRERSLAELEGEMDTLRRHIRWEQPDGQRAEGLALGLERSGGLQVRLPDGIEKVLHAAQIHHLRSLP